MTVFTFSISRPLATRSVANKTPTSPSLNFLNASRRCEKKPTRKLNFYVAITKFETTF